MAKINYTVSMEQEVLLDQIAEEFGIDIPCSDDAILEAVALAQVASDGGKGIDRFRRVNSLTEEAYDLGYDVKDYYILTAILGCIATGTSSVKWFISSNWEVDWFDMHSIVYFEWNGMQISFHSFTDTWKRIRDVWGYKETVWDEGSSPLTCLRIMEYLSWNRPMMVALDYVSEADDRLDAAQGIHPVSGDYARGIYPELGVWRHYYAMDNGYVVGCC